MFDWIKRETPENLMERLRRGDLQLAKNTDYFVKKMRRSGLPGLLVLHKNFGDFEDVDQENGTTSHVANIWLSAGIAKQVGDDAYRYLVQVLTAHPSDGWAVRVLCYSVGVAPALHADFKPVTFSDRVREELVAPLAKSVYIYGDDRNWSYSLQLLARIVLPEDIAHVVAALSIDQVRRLIGHVKREQSLIGRSASGSDDLFNEALQTKIRETIWQMVEAMRQAVPNLPRKDPKEIGTLFASREWPQIPEPFQCVSVSELVEKVNKWAVGKVQGVTFRRFLFGSADGKFSIWECAHRDRQIILAEVVASPNSLYWWWR